jgi:predicted alpha/beta hydrolase
MPSRGRHQSTSKECKLTIAKIEALDGVIGVIIGHSYGGKSLGQNSRTGAIKVQRIEDAGIKAAMQSAKGLQELFVRTEAGKEKNIAKKIAELP